MSSTKTMSNSNWYDVLDSHFLFVDVKNAIIGEYNWSDDEDIMIRSLLHNHPMFQTKNNTSQSNITGFIYDMILFLRFSKAEHPNAIYSNANPIITRIEKILKPECLSYMLGEDTEYISGILWSLNHRYFMMLSEYWKKEDEGSIILYLSLLPILKDVLEKTNIAIFICDMLLNIKYGLYDIAKKEKANKEDNCKHKNLKRHARSILNDVIHGTNPVNRCNSAERIALVFFDYDLICKKIHEKTILKIREQRDILESDIKTHTLIPDHIKIAENINIIHSKRYQKELEMVEDEHTEFKSKKFLKFLVEEITIKGKGKAKQGGKEYFLKFMHELLALANNQTRRGKLIIGVEDKKDINGTLIISGITSKEIHPNDYDAIGKEIDNFIKELKVYDIIRKIEVDLIVMNFITMDRVHVVVDGIIHNLLIFNVSPKNIGGNNYLITKSNTLVMKRLAGIERIAIGKNAESTKN